MKVGDIVSYIGDRDELIRREMPLDLIEEVLNGRGIISGIWEPREFYNIRVTYLNDLYVVYFFEHNLMVIPLLQLEDLFADAGI